MQRYIDMFTKEINKEMFIDKGKNWIPPNYTLVRNRINN